MFIKSYECKRFAGLKDTFVEFSDGLNVILGPNESGKSTIIDGIHSTLFKNIRLRKSFNPDKEFTFKYMPEPKGDYIDGKVILETEGGQYKISKEWGSSQSIQLETPKGNLLRDEKEINNELKRLLSFGESTYSNIVFAKQRELKAALSNIIGNREVTKEINDILRMALMELDGISIDSIQRNIDEEVDNLYKRWDIEKNYPENNRGVNNPYKVGLGIIIESYYKKENIKLHMENADATEKEFAKITSQIKSARENRELIDKEKSQLEEIEDDVNKRAILNSEIELISRDLDILMEINKEWPRSEEKLRQVDEKLRALKERKEKLDQEKKNLEKISRKNVLKEKLSNLESIEEKVKLRTDEIANIPLIDKKDIENLSKLQNDLLTCKTTMEAGKMIGLLRKSSGKNLYVTRDFGEEIHLEENVEFQANGLIKISYADEFEMEIKTGEIDFEELIDRYKSLEEEYSNLLQVLKIENLEVGKLNLAAIEKKENEKSGLLRELNILLDGNTKEELMEELESLGDIKVNRDLEEIELELSETSNEEIELSAEEKSIDGKIESWIEKYKDHDNLFDKVIEERSKLKIKKEEIDGLKALPKRFESPEEFKSRLTSLKVELSHIQASLEDLSNSYYEAKGNLSEDSYEDLKKEYLQAESTYDSNIRRGKKLLEIQRIFHETKNRLASNPMETLVAEFSRLLESITDGRYKTSDIDEEFNIRLENHNGQIPIDLLSAGTYDCVSLALRFSLVNHIFEDEGYVVLDDCLVDLDPVRKAQSIDLIKVFSNDYQIIFTTCDPETAEMLGGNLIELQ